MARIEAMGCCRSGRPQAARLRLQQEPTLMLPRESKPSSWFTISSMVRCTSLSPPAPSSNRAPPMASICESPRCQTRQRAFKVAALNACTVMLGTGATQSKMSRSTLTADGSGSTASGQRHPKERGRRQGADPGWVVSRFPGVLLWQPWTQQGKVAAVIGHMSHAAFGVCSWL